MDYILHEYVEDSVTISVVKHLVDEQWANGAKKLHYNSRNLRFNNFSKFILKCVRQCGLAILTELLYGARCCQPPDAASNFVFHPQ